MFMLLGKICRQAGDGTFKLSESFPEWLRFGSGGGIDSNAHAFGQCRCIVGHDDSLMNDAFQFHVSPPNRSELEQSNR